MKNLSRSSKDKYSLLKVQKFNILKNLSETSKGKHKLLKIYSNWRGIKS